jgi:hypothetical protein
VANDFLPFGTSVGANVLDQASYAALPARTAGFSAGTAKSVELNKVWRQSAFIASVLAQFIADTTGQNVLDDGNAAALQAKLVTALRGVVASESLAGAIQIATTAEAQERANDSHALTPKKLADAFKGANQLLASPGFQIAPGGLILQFGPANFSTAGVGNTFPMVFPNALRGIAFGNSGPSGTAVLITAYDSSTTGFTCRSNNSSGSYWYLAFGN